MSFFGDTSVQKPAEERKLANISDDAINSNQQAVPVKYLAGRAYIAGDYISPAYNPRAIPITTQTGKGEESVTGYKYFCDFALIFCMGGRHPVDSIHSIIVDSDIVWRGNVTRGNANKEVIQVPNYGTIHLYWGGETQGIDNILLQPRTAGAGNQQDSTTWNANSGPNPFSGLAAGDPNPYSGHYDRHPAYRGQCYAVFKNWKLGRDRTSVPNIQFELKRGCPWLNGQQVAADNKGVNPIVILYDWLTDPRFGMEFPEAALSQSSFIQTKAALEALGARLSVSISEQSEFRQMVAELLEYYDGWIRNNGGLLEVGFWTHGSPVSSATLTDDDLLGDPELEPQGWGPTLNEVTVVYSDRDHHFNTYSQTARDPNNRRITGSPRPITLQRPWLTDATLAKKYAHEYCKIKALPYTAGQLHVKREWLDAHNMLPGKVFTYNSGFYNLSIMMRLLEVEREADSSAKATLTVEWERAVWPSMFVPNPIQGPGGFELGPRAIWRARITEVPYLMQDRRFLTQIVALAIKGNTEVIGFRVWASFDGGATYQDIANTNNFSAFGRVAANFGSQTLWFWIYLYGVALDEVVSQTNAQALDDNLLCFIDAEVLSVGQVIAHGNGLYQISAYRGRFGTARQDHLANADIYFIFRNRLRLLDNAGFVPGSTLKFKLQPFTSEEDYDLTSVSPINYTVVGWTEIPPPDLSPPAGTFVSNVRVFATTIAGMTIRYTTDGTTVLANDLIFPLGGLLLSATTFLRVRAYAANGRYSNERLAHYTKVTQGAQGNQACSPPSRSFSGVRTQTGGNLTLTPTTPGSTTKFRKNGGAVQTYSSPIALACNAAGDTCEYWAEKPGLDPSSHVFFDNTRFDPGGGGGGGQPPNPP